MGDIARLAGVSRPTVSRALKRDPRLSEATIKRVQQIADELGYEYDPAFAVLARARKQADGVSFRSTLAFLRGTDSQFEAYLEGASAKARQLGYGVETFDIRNPLRERAVDRTLFARGIRGVVLPILEAGRSLPDFHWERYSVVACNTGHQPHPFHAVRSDVSRKITLAWEKMKQAGHQRIGIALPHDPNTWSELDQRRSGLALYLQHQQKPPHRVAPWLGTYGEWPKFWDWALKSRLDGLICGFPLDVRQLRELTKRKMEACSISPQSDVSYVSSRPMVIGASAISLLHQQLIENERGLPQMPTTVLVPPEWVDAPSQ